MSAAGQRPSLWGLRIADTPEHWQAVGFTVQNAELRIGDVAVELRPEPSGDTGIMSWTLSSITPVDSIDGLPTEVIESLPASQAIEHDNGAVTIDHVVITTPDFARTADALAEADLELRRIREAPGGIRQGFRRLGQTILELVELKDAPDPTAPARFWGLVVVVRDLDALAEHLGPLLGSAKDAVQPGRRIATLRGAAGLGPAVAFMTPEP